MSKNKKMIKEQKKLYQELQELEEEYLYFRRNAHEEDDSDLLFPYLML